MNNGKLDLTPLYSELQQLKAPDHLCLIYNDLNEWETFTSAFIKIGLERHEKCYYVFDTHNYKQIQNALKKYGVDTAAAEESGQLTIVHGSKIYLRDGSFETRKMISILISAAEKACSEGYTSFRVTGERGWVLQGLPGSESNREYETVLNRDFISRYNCLAVCQYDSQQFGHETIKNLIFTHPGIIRNNRVFVNPFYVSPEQFLAEESIGEDTKYWFNNIELHDRQEKELQDKENRLQILFNKALNPIVLIDENGHYIEANQAALDFVECSMDELLNKTIWNGFTAEILKEKDIEQDLFLYPQNFDMDCTINGKRKTIILNTIPITIGGKKAIYVIGQDITDRKKTENALKESEAFNTKLLGNSPYPVLITNRDSTIQYVNSALEKLTGYSRSELIGTRVPYPWWVKEKWAQYESEGEVAISQQLNINVRCHRKKNGELFWITVNTLHINEKDGSKYYITNWIDITENKKAEEALKQSEIKFRTLFEQSQDGIILTDKNGIIVGWNRACERVTGINKSDIIGQPIWNIHLALMPADKKDQQTMEMVHSNLNVFLQDHKFPHLDGLAEHEIQHPDGSRRVIQISPFLIQAGTEILNCVSLRDITKRKRVEQELEAEARARGMFINVLAHELRTPLTPVLSSTSILNEFRESPSYDIYRRLVTNVYNGAKIVTERLEELLELGDYSRGTVKLQLEYTNIEKYLKEISVRLESLLKGQQNIHLDLDQNLPITQIDPSGLEKALKYLIANAVNLSSETDTITLRARTQDRELLIEVEDNGQGITEEEKQRIFQPYHRVEQDRQKFPGLGLGLAVARKMVEAHAGKLWLVSNAERGNVFKLILPIRMENAS